MSANNKVAEIMTARIVEEMEKNRSCAWQKPWNVVGFRNVVSKKAYRGFNVLMLSILGGTDTWFLTFNQAKALGGTVNKGSKGIPIVYYKLLEKKNESGDVEKRFPLLRYYTVFGLSQTNGVKTNLPTDNKLDFVPHEMAEKLVAASGVTIKHGGNAAFYTPATHTITMPAKEQFKSVAHYYATLFHELTHWTSKEIGITLDGHFGGEPYSKEELTAEIGANFLMNYCGLDTTGVFDNSIAYLNNWLEKLRNDSKLIIQAANGAQKRFDWLLAKLNPTETEETEETATPENFEMVAA